LNGKPSSGQPSAGGRARLWLRRFLTGGGYLGFALCLALLGVLLAVTVPKFFGYQSFVIYSGSMEPSVKVGSLLVAKPVAAENLQVGDVIVFRHPESPNTTITHRIAGIREENGQRIFTTKGDASSNPDPREVRLQGQVGKMAYTIPYLGYLVDFIRTKEGALIFLVAPALGLGLMHLWKERKKRRARPVGAQGSQAEAAVALPSPRSRRGRAAAKSLKSGTAPSAEAGRQATARASPVASLKRGAGDG
jgi:signal peptidase